MTTATALNNAQKAALAAEFGKVYKGTRVKQNVADALVARLASKGDSLMDINDVLTLEADDEATWRAIWSQIFAEAGLKDASDLERFAKWARARGTDAGAGIALHGHAQSRRAIEVLETNGMTVTSAIRSELEAVLANGEAGSEREQCCCALTVFIIYLGRAPTEEEKAWWLEQFNQLGGADGGQIEITKCPSFAKTHSKTPDSCQTLERALKKESSFSEYSVKTLELLNRAGMYKAAARLMKVLSLALKQSGGSWARRKVYLFGYFFEEHTGLGLPVEMAYQSAINAMAVPAAAEKLTELPGVFAGASAAGSMTGSMASWSDYSALGGSVSEAGGSGAGSAFDMRALATVK